MRGLSPFQKRQVAEKFLAWLKKNNTKSWDSTYLILIEASEAINEAVYDLWKAHDLLITLGKIERISPNGRKGCRVANYAPLTKPIPSEALICSRDNCPIMKRVLEIWK